MSLYGWFHTFMGIFALLSGFYSLVKYKVIDSQNTSAKIFLICTLVAAVTALTLYKQGGFGVGTYACSLDTACLNCRQNQ